MFGIEGGFDVVIGNPPYVRQENISDLKPTLQAQYECYTGYSDLYVYFYEQGVRLLNENGLLVFISSNKYFRSGYGQKLRTFLTSKTSIRQLIDFGDAPVFTAIAYPSIIVTQKRKYAGGQANILSWNLGDPLEEFENILHTRSFAMEQGKLSSDGWRLESSVVLGLIDKLHNSGKPLSEHIDSRLYYGIKTGFNEAFIIDEETKKRLILEDRSSSKFN